MRKKRRVLLWLIGIIIVVALSIIIQALFQDKICLDKGCVSVVLADTPELRARGLQKEENLPENKGMLFIFNEEGSYSFWMKDTLIHLDMIWINKQWEIVHIQYNAEPCTQIPCPAYSSPLPAMFVLEINSGEALILGADIGDKIEFTKSFLKGIFAS